mgnify:CR=1 FL=1
MKPKQTFLAACAAMMALSLLAIVACGGPHMAQYAHYHGFADQRTAWGVPCAGDVLSNLPFAAMGVWGLWRLRGWAQPSRLLRLPRSGGAGPDLLRE